MISFNGLAQRLAMDHPHAVAWSSFWRYAYLINRNDARMFQLAGELSFQHEIVAGLFGFAPFIEKHFQCYRPVEIVVCSQVDLPQPTCCSWFQALVVGM